MLDRNILRQIVNAALAEDIGKGDATTEAVVPESLHVTAVMKTRTDCICAGLPAAEQVFRELDPDCEFTVQADEGGHAKAGSTLARIRGRARAVLTGERTALNFLQRLTGIATMTGEYVAATSGYHTRILDTRKTTPGLRVLEKYAVKIGGGENHRFGLYDRIMIKDNHRLIAKLEGPDAIMRAVEQARTKHPELEVEVEADTLEEVQAATEAKADYILLDNMEDEEVEEAVDIVEGRCLLEASGGITLERIPALAATGVDFISVGALTHSAPAADISLDIKLEKE